MVINSTNIKKTNNCLSP